MSDVPYPIFVRPLSADDGGGYLAFAPDLHGCVGDGDTPEEAVADLRSAIDEWCDEARRLGNPQSWSEAVLQTAAVTNFATPSQWWR